jgi:hypothetical protein
MAESHPVPLPQQRGMQETSSLQCLGAIVLSHQKIRYSFSLWPDSLTINVASQVPITVTSTGRGPPSPSTEVANPDDIHSSIGSTKPSSNPPPSTIQGRTNNPGAQDEENEGSLSDDQGIESSTENTSITSESSADEYSSDPDFQRAVQNVN